MIKRGDIYFIRDTRQSIGSEQKADRPAVIVSNDANNKHSGVYEVVYMTTQPKTDLPTHFITSSALRTSTVLCEQISRHHVKTYEHGVLSPQNPTNVYRTLTGTGGKAWEALGVCDIMGDVHKWVVARLVDGEIQIVPNNNAAIHKTDLGANSKAWKAILQDGSLVAPGTNGTLKFDYTGNPANATSGFHITTTVEHKQTDDGAGYGAKDFGTLTAKSGVTIPDILKALALFPNTDKTGRGFIYFRNNGERLLFRGGFYGSGGLAGEASGNFDYPRSISYVAVGLFSAYVDPALYA